MSHVHADFNPQDAASELVDHQPGVVSGLDARPHEAPRIGSFATGLANDEPRAWSGKQMVGDVLRRGK